MICPPILISNWKRTNINGIKVLVAKTFCEKQQGLQNTNAVDFSFDTIILFVGATTGSFHTRNCRFPLEIAFIGKDLRLISARLVGPNISNILIPNGCYYVLEANLGWLASHKVGIGDKLSFINLIG